MNQKYLVLVILFLIGIFATESFAANHDKKNDTSILRLDKDLFGYLNKPDKQSEAVLINKYPTLLPALAQTISNTSDQVDVFKGLRDYFSHPSLKKIYSDAIAKFNDLSLYENELGIISQAAKSELNLKHIPSFSVHVSGFKENIIYINNVVSLSIDKYMGREYPIYKQFFTAHQLEQMQPKMIIRDFTRAWLMADVIKTESTSGDLLSEMIEQGKLLYSLSILIPTYSEAELIGYTSDEYNWVSGNTKTIWDYILKRNHLYTNDRHIISLYFEQDSSTKQIIEGTPAQIGAWIGFQIVKEYARRSDDTLNTVLQKDAKTILKESKYKP